MLCGLEKCRPQMINLLQCRFTSYALVGKSNGLCMCVHAMHVAAVAMGGGDNIMLHLIV